jgi:hypothetical protein
MNTLRTLTVTTATIILTVALVLPAGATEAGSQTKWQVFTRSPHSTVGGFILLALLVFVGAAIVNAVQQLRGKRRQADGKFRWR